MFAPRSAFSEGAKKSYWLLVCSLLFLLGGSDDFQALYVSGQTLKVPPIMYTVFLYPQLPLNLEFSQIAVVDPSLRINEIIGNEESELNELSEPQGRVQA